MRQSHNIHTRCALALGVLSVAIGGLASTDLSSPMVLERNGSIYSEMSLPFSNEAAKMYSNGTEKTFEKGSLSLSAATPAHFFQRERNVGVNRHSKSVPGYINEQSLVMGELKSTIEQLLTKPSNHPLHKLTLKINRMLHHVGFWGECSVVSPWRLQDMVFKVINYVALGVPRDESRGDDRTMEEHPIQEMIHLFADRYQDENCIRYSNFFPSQKELEQLLQGLKPAIKNHLWEILSVSPLQAEVEKFHDLRKFSPEFFRYLCREGLQNSEDRARFCSETAVLNSMVYTNTTFVEKNRQKRFAHPDDQVLDKIFRRAGYGHGHGHGHYEKPAEPEIVIIEDDDKKKDDKHLFIPKIVLVVGTYILLCLLSLKAFFLSHAGEKGDKGEPGMDGEKGDKGLKGFPGLKGKRGYPGLKGDKGDPGADGLPGEKGDKGFPGEMGYPGEKGHPGEKGDDGEKGAKGEKGQKGQQGKPGHRGPRGPRGRPAFHGGHRKRRDLDEARSRFGGNLTNRFGPLTAEFHEPILEKLTELSHRNSNGSATDKSASGVPLGVMGPGAEKNSKNINLKTIEVNSVPVTAETRPLLGFDQNETDPRVFPVGPDGKTYRQAHRKIVNQETHNNSKIHDTISRDRGEVSDLIQHLRLLSANRKAFHPYRESEFIISAMNELWQLYETQNGCLTCGLFKYLNEQPSMDLDSYIIAGFAHVLGDAGSLQLLDRVRAAKTQKKELRCVQYDVKKCEIESLNGIKT